jgi:hypothetical protein
VKRTYAEEILGEWGPRAEGSVEWQREGARLQGEEGLSGRPLQRRLRSPFDARTELYARAIGGVPAHIRRLRKIDDEADAQLEQLAVAYEELAHECADDDARFARAWRALAAGWDFFELNDLIGRHNRWYPVEAALPMDPKTGDFIPVGGRPYRRRLLDAAWILERFPASLPDLVAA